jgi:hypothetical protein
MFAMHAMKSISFVAPRSYITDAPTQIAQDLCHETRRQCHESAVFSGVVQNAIPSGKTPT